jgi:hypothetical protein
VGARQRSKAAAVSGDRGGWHEVLQLEEEMGEVRGHPAEEKGVCGSSSLWRGKWRWRWLEIRQGAAAVRPPARTRGRGKGRGAHGELRRENGGRGKGAWQRQAAPF